MNTTSLKVRFSKWFDEFVLSGISRLGFPVGERTRTLFYGLQWNAPAAAVSRVLCGLATLFVARYLGPAGFGKANLALAATLWIQVPLFCGLTTAIMHYVPRALPKERDPWAATGLCLLAVSSSLTLCVGFFFRTFWARVHGVSPDTFDLALAWCAGFVIFSAATSLLSARERFPMRAVCELVFALLFPACIAIFWKGGKLSPATYILAFTVAYGLSGVIGLVRGWPQHLFFPGFTARLKMMLSYGALASLGSVMNALLNAPGRLVANRYLPLSDVGVLSAYQGGSTQMALFFVAFGSQVFFPIASRTPNRQALFNKISRFMLLSGPLLCLAYAGCLTIYMLFLGKHYPLRARDVIAFSLAAALTSFYALFSWFLASKGRRGLIVNSSVGLIAGTANLWGCHLLIPRWGITGAGWAYAFSALAGILICHLPFIQHDHSEPLSTS